MRTPFAESPEFRRLVEGESRVSLARIALEIARDFEPGLEIEGYVARIDELAGRVRERCGAVANAKPKSRTILGQINWVLFIEEGFRGNQSEYYDPRNSYLDAVLDRRLGIPISLAILYAEVAARLDLGLSGVNLPAHFVLRLDESDPAVFIDAYHGGARLDRRGCEERVSTALGSSIVLADEDLAPCGPLVTVGRLLRNLKTIHVQDDDFPAALKVARRLGTLEPSNFEEQRDWGVLAYQTGHPGESVAPLTRYRDGRPDAADAQAVADLLRAARRDVARSN